MADIASYVGGFTIGGSIPGALDVLVQLDSKLNDFISVVRVQADALLTAQASIRIPAVVDFQAELDASVAVTAGFQAQLANPSAYVSTLLTGMAAVQASLQAAVPTAALNAQISASGSAGLVAEAKIAAVDLALEVLAVIRVALLAAINATANAYAFFSAYLDAPGAHCFLYTGTRGGLGGAVDLVTPGTGIGASTNVKAIVVLVEEADVAARVALEAVFRMA